MPVTMKKIGKKYRVIEKATGLPARTNKGHPVDGGGHVNRRGAMAQVRAINASIYGKHGQGR